MEIIKKSGKALQKAVKIITGGGIVICPTDTVYGFLADATNRRAVEKIFKIKKRPKQKSLPIFVRGIKMARKIAEINTKQEKFISKYWPGEYTFVFKRNPKSKLYGVAKDSVALRIPKHNFLQKLLKRANRPVAQTSVNISGEKSLSNIEDIIEEFKNENKISLIVNGGNIKKAKPSKIIDLRETKIEILRN